jgi:hypothetical protein
VRPPLHSPDHSRVHSTAPGCTTLAEPQLPRKPNYDFEKRRKELDRKAKQEEKLRRKRENARGEPEESPSPLPDEGPTATPE